MKAEATNLHGELEERLQFETLIADLSSRFINLPVADVDREIEDALRRVCELLGIDLAVVWQWSTAAPDVIAPTHAYPALGGLQPPEPLHQEQFPWLRQQILAGRVAALSSLEEFPAEAAVDREFCRQYGVKSHLSLPLAVGGESPVGLLGLNTMRAERDWEEALVNRLQLVAQVFANALARKRVDLALRESKERLSLTMESAEAGLWVLDCPTGVFWATEEARALFGLSPDEAVGMDRFKALVHPDDWDSVHGAIARAVKEGDPVNLEYRIRLEDDRTRWIASRGRPHFAPTGEPQRLMGISVDITERRQTEEDLRASEARLAAGADLAGLGYYEVDYGEGTSFMDDRFCEICGVPEEHRKGLAPVQFWSERIHPDDRQNISEQRDELHSGKIDRISAEYRYSHPTHGERWLHHSARVAGRSAGGDGIRTYGVIRDITDHRQVETEMRRLRIQLWHADRVAQTGAITASLAHELNQPLTGILSTAQAGLRFMAGGNADAELIEEMLTNIVHDTKRAGAVINGLRSMLRHKDTQRAPIGLAGTIHEILDLLHSELVGRQVEARQNLEPDLTVLADKAQIQQVILNLAMNAMEAMQDQPADQRRLEITLTRSTDGEALVAVRDSGPGISEDQMQKVFDAFWTTKQQGMGIGLAVSRAIIESHGGRLWFANNLDRGATFCFSLPLNRRDEGRGSQ